MNLQMVFVNLFRLRFQFRYKLHFALIFPNLP